MSINNEDEKKNTLSAKQALFVFVKIIMFLIVFHLFGSIIGALLTNYVFWTIFDILRRHSKFHKPKQLILNPTNPDLLKGREEDIESLYRYCKESRLIFLEGESGSGKSTLVQAGLIPRCKEEGRFLPIYFDIAAMDWDELIFDFFSYEFWNSLTEEQKNKLSLASPPDATKIFDILKTVYNEIGVKPLLLFDQLDDYQTKHSARFLKNKVWIDKDELISNNRFWRSFCSLIEDDKSIIHTIFVTCTDTAGALEPFRFITPKPYLLTLINQNLIAPLLDDVTKDEVILNPEKEWMQIKQRLLRDLATEGSILPIQLTVCLQALRYFKFLTIAEYENAGSAKGLERLHIEFNIEDTAKNCSIPIDKLREVLRAMVDGSKTKLVSFKQMLNIIEPNNPTPVLKESLQMSLYFLEGRRIVRLRSSRSSDEAEWSLHNDFLSRGVEEAYRHANECKILLQERVHYYFQPESNLANKWRAMLSLREQVKLLYQRYFKKSFHYAEHRNFALKSVVMKQIPSSIATVLILSLVFQMFWIYQDRQEAARIFSQIDSSYNVSNTNKERSQISILASSSSTVRFEALRLAFQNSESADRVLKRKELFLQACLQLDLELRDKVWEELIYPIAKTNSKDPSNKVLVLVADAILEIKVGQAETGKLVDKVLLAMEKESNSDNFSSVGKLADKFLSAMEKESNSDNFSSLSKAFVFLAEKVGEAEAGRLADKFLLVLEKDNSFFHFSELLATFKLLADKIGEAEAERLADRVLSAIEKKEDFENLFYALPPLAKKVRKAGKLADRLLSVIEKEKNSDIIALLSEAFELLADKIGEAEAKRLADRLLSVIEKEKNSDIIALLSEAFGSLVEKGKVEREKVEKVASCLLSAIEKEEDSGKRSFLSWVFRSLVEKGKVEREKVEKVASYLLLAIEKEEDSEKLSFLSEAFGSLVEKGKVEREKVEKVASYLLSAIEKEEHSYELSSLSKAFVLLVEKVGKAEAGKLADRLLSAMKKEEDLKRFSCLSRAFILSVEKGKVEREKVEKVASYLLSVIEKEEDFDNLLSLSEDFASLADKVGEAEAGKLADRLLSLIEKEKDSHNLFLSLSKAFSLLGRKEKIEKFVTKILSSIELQEDFYTFLFLLEAFSSLAETGKVEPWEVEKIANKLLLVVDDDLSLLDTDRNIPTALLSVVDKSESKTKQRFFKWLSKFASQRETSRIFNYYVDSEHFSRILQEASEQELVDILKQPFVAGKIQEACLKAFELKFKLEKPEEKFDGNLYKFLKWVKTNKDEKIRKLDLSSPIVN